MTTLAYQPAERIWSLEQDAPHLLQALTRRRTCDQFLDATRSRLPAPPTCEPFEFQSCTRPARHLRSYYLHPHGATGSVIAIKGSEVCVRDVDHATAASAKVRRAAFGLSVHEKLLLNERKVPMALRRGEALAEAAAAARFQSDYLERYGRLAHVPLPLVVWAIPDAVAQAHQQRLTARASALTVPLVEQLMGEGLACYAYHYPSLPVRVRDVVQPIGSCGIAQSYRSRKARVSAGGDPLALVQSWVQLAVDILALGYLPVDISNYNIGNCLQWQNAVMDGGVVDVDSIHPLHPETSDQEVSESLMAMILWLSDTVHALLVAGRTMTTMQPTLLLVAAQIHRQIAAEISRRADEPRLDARVRRFFGAQSWLEGLDASLHAMFPEESVTGHGRY